MREPANPERVGSFILDRRKDGSFDFSLPAGELPVQIFVRFIPGIILGLIAATYATGGIFVQLLAGFGTMIILTPVVLWSFTIRRGFTISKSGLEVRDFDQLRFSTIQIPAAELTKCTYEIEKGSRTIFYTAHFHICSTHRVLEVFTYKDVSEVEVKEVVQNWLKLLKPFFPKHH